jgi:hypothetical protein
MRCVLRCLLPTLWSCVALERCDAQTDWLTLSESEQLLEKLPAFRSAEASGDCPGFVVLDPPRYGEFSLQLRGFCPPEGLAGSTTISNLAIDRVTGHLINWASGRLEIEPPELQALARALTREAKTRALSKSEAECVAMQAVRDQPIPGAGLSITWIDRNAADTIHLRIEQRLDELRATVAWDLLVNTRYPAVLDSDYRRVNSSRADALLSQMQAARALPSLSPLDAIEVAAQVPSVAALLQGSCSRLAADYGTSQSRFITTENTCQTYPRSVSVVATVNVFTGAVTNPKTLKKLDSAESARLAEERLRRAGARRAAAKAEIEHTCQVE